MGAAYPAHSADALPEAGVKTAKTSEAAPVATTPVAPDAVPAAAPAVVPDAAPVATPPVAPSTASDHDATPPGTKPAAKETEAGGEPPRRRRDRPSRSGGARTAPGGSSSQASGQETLPSPTSPAVAPASPTPSSPNEPLAGGAAAAPKKKAEKLRFQFRYQPWKDVLDWFAQQADLSLVIPETFPQGTFNYSDTRQYTPSEAIDLLNSVLQTKGFTLVRRERMLMLVNLEDPIPSILMPTVPVESLENRGESEMVNTQFPLSKIRPEDVEAEVQKLLGPQGTVKSLAKSQQLSVTDTVGHLRTVRDYLKRIEGPEGTLSSGLKTFHLKYARPEDVLPILRQMLDIPEDKNSAVDGSIRVALEAGADRLLVSGRPDKVARASEIVEGLDVPAPGSEGTSRLSGTPQLEVYPLNGCDGASLLAVLQTLMVGQSDVRLSIDPKAGSLIALARPAQHATIRATLAQLQHEGIRVEVIRLTRVDPQSALLSINKLFSSGDPKQPSTNAPQIDADSTTHQLLIRGTDAQITQIRDLLTKLGERLNPGDESQGGHVRSVPMSEGTARAVLQRVEEIWPTMRPNKIRVVSPSAGAAELPRDAKPATEPKKSLPLRGEPPRLPEQKPQEVPKTAPVPKVTMTRDLPLVPTLHAAAHSLAAPRHDADGDYGDAERSYGALRRGSVVTRPVDAPARPGKLFAARIFCVADLTPVKPAPEGKPPAPIIVIPGPNGLTIASEDLEALDEFERLLTTAADGSGGGPVTVFYLKHAKAQAVAETLDKILAGGAVETEGAAEKAVDAMRLSASRRALATGPIKITPEVRLNALLVQANRADQDTIEQLLKILDLKESPEDIDVAPKPRMIALEHARAKDVAEVLRQVYADRLASAQPQQQGGGFLPFFMRGMGGGPGGPGGFGGRGGQDAGGGQNRRDDATRISIGVDARTNNLIIAAVDPVFEEAKQLVQQLDLAAAAQNETVRVVTLHRTSAAAVEKALSAFAGDAVQSNNADTSGNAANNNPAPSMSPWANRGFGGSFGGQQPGGQPGVGGGQPGGGFQPGQGFNGGGGRRRGRYSQGGAGQ